MKTYYRINVCQEHLVNISKAENWDITLDAITYNSQGELPVCDVCLMEYDENERQSCEEAIVTIVGAIDIEEMSRG